MLASLIPPSKYQQEKDCFEPIRLQASSRGVTAAHLRMLTSVIEGKAADFQVKYSLRKAFSSSKEQEVKFLTKIPTATKRLRRAYTTTHFDLKNKSLLVSLMLFQKQVLAGYTNFAGDTNKRINALCYRCK